MTVTEAIPSPLVMGVVNVTPDSFVAEVRTPGPDAAVERGLVLAAEGASIVDVGGESTRPGATPVPLDVELERVVPVVEGLAGRLPDGIAISVDTLHEPVARAAVAAGATIINDMGMTLGSVAGDLGVGYVAGHMQGTPQAMQDNPTYDDVVSEVFDLLTGVAAEAASAGADPVWIDPGIGFGKTWTHNFELLAALDRFREGGHRVLVGVSRKGFIGRLHASADQRVGFGSVDAVPTGDRLEASVAMAAWAAALGADVVRAHDVEATVQALQVVSAENRRISG